MALAKAPIIPREKPAEKHEVVSSNMKGDSQENNTSELKLEARRSSQSDQERERQRQSVKRADSNHTIPQNIHEDNESFARNSFGRRAEADN